MNLATIHKVAFVGIGGIGMSALARFFMQRGAEVRGFDKTETDLTRSLSAEGAVIHYNDDVAAVFPQAELVVYTPAIPKDSAELAWYRDNGFAVYKRSDVLQWITESMQAITVAGTHGKTTISTMIAYLLRETPAEPGKEPAVITADKSDKKPAAKADAKAAVAAAPVVAAPKDEKAEIVKTDALKAGDPKEAKGPKTDGKDVAKADAAKPADAAKVAEAKSDEASKPEAALGDAAKANKGSKDTPQPAVQAASTQQGPAMIQQVLTETWSYQLPADE